LTDKQSGRLTKPLLTTTSKFSEILKTNAELMK
jgi:hypothetical protein